jgi:periplasmic divalent cation tolerance protein
MVFIYTSCRNSEEAKGIGRQIIERRLAACVHIAPIDSIYWWDGKVTEDTEAVLLVKTNESKVQDIEDLILRSHTYSTPFIGVLDVRRVNREYKEWMSRVMN